MAFPTEPLALVFYASILISIGISIFLAWKADLKRQDWVIYGAGILLAVIFGALGYTGQLSTRWELALGYWPGLLTYTGAPKIAGIIPYGLPGPMFFAI
ncbi:MAG: hypothetical protein SVU32_02900, partial [Candidatus Nanohaloarchaea archaeon]|nr:hypothetical protein [Candidatus Nanohaloarchaea archaeon]